MSIDVKKIREKTVDVLLEIGIPMSISGTPYIIEAVCKSIESPFQTMTKDLYPYLAKTFKTNPMGIERAIRNAIKISCDKGRIIQINKIFGVEIYKPNERPYNSEFIALLVEKIPTLLLSWKKG